MASLSEVFLAGEPEYAERYREAREAEDRIFRQLRPLAASLGPTVQRQFAEAEQRIAPCTLGKAAAAKAPPGPANT